MDKLEIKQGSFIQQTQYFIPVEIDLSVVPARLGIWFFHLSCRTTVIQDLLVRRQFSLVPDNRTNVNVEAWIINNLKYEILILIIYNCKIIHVPRDIIRFMSNKINSVNLYYLQQMPSFPLYNILFCQPDFIKFSQVSSRYLQEDIFKNILIWYC